MWEVWCHQIPGRSQLNDFCPVFFVLGWSTEMENVLVVSPRVLKPELHIGVLRPRNRQKNNEHGYPPLLLNLGLQQNSVAARIWAMVQRRWTAACWPLSQTWTFSKVHRAKSTCWVTRSSSEVSSDRTSTLKIWALVAWVSGWVLLNIFFSSNPGMVFCNGPIANGLIHFYSFFRGNWSFCSFNSYLSSSESHFEANPIFRQHLFSTCVASINCQHHRGSLATSSGAPLRPGSSLHTWSATWASATSGACCCMAPRARGRRWSHGNWPSRPGGEIQQFFIIIRWLFLGGQGLVVGHVQGKWVNPA